MVAVSSVSSSIATTSSPASPDGCKRLVSKTKTSRSVLPARPRLTSVANQAPRISERLEDEAKALRSSRASSIATTLKRETISTSSAGRRDLVGANRWIPSATSRSRPKARRLQVATKRLRSRCRGGIATLRAAAASPAELLALDVDLRLAGIWAELARFDELTLEVSAALIRAADSRATATFSPRATRRALPRSCALHPRGAARMNRDAGRPRLTLSCRRSGMGASGSSRKHALHVGLETNARAAKLATVGSLKLLARGCLVDVRVVVTGLVDDERPALLGIEDDLSVTVEALDADGPATFGRLERVHALVGERDDELDPPSGIDPALDGELLAAAPLRYGRPRHERHGDDHKDHHLRRERPQSRPRASGAHPDEQRDGGQGEDKRRNDPRRAEASAASAVARRVSGGDVAGVVPRVARERRKDAH